VKWNQKRISREWKGVCHVNTFQPRLTLTWGTECSILHTHQNHQFKVEACNAGHNHRQRSASRLNDPRSIDEEAQMPSLLTCSVRPPSCWTEKMAKTTTPTNPLPIWHGDFSWSVYEAMFNLPSASNVPIRHK
jgi:hypothetical protein